MWHRNQGTGHRGEKQFFLSTLPDLKIIKFGVPLEVFIFYKLGLKLDELLGGQSPIRLRLLVQFA